MSRTADATLAAGAAKPKAAARKPRKAAADESPAAAETAAPWPPADLSQALDALHAFFTGQGPRPQDDPPALADLAARLGLSRFERDVLLLAAAADLEPRFRALFAEGQGDPQRPWPSFELVAALLPPGDRAAVTPVGRLRRWQLVELVGPGGPMSAHLQLDETILQRLLGFAYPEPRLEPWCRPVAVARPGEADAPAERDEAALQAIAADWGASSSLATAPVALVVGGDAAAFAPRLAAHLRMQLLRLAPRLLPAAAHERETLLRLVEREALLGNALLWIDAQGVAGEDASALAALVEHAQALVVVTGVDALPLRRAQRRVERARLDAPGRLAVWRRALGGRGTAASLGGLAEQFALDAEDITRLAAADAGGAGQAERLWDAARAASRRGFDGLAQRLEARAGWDELVLPEEHKRSLHALVAQVRQRARVYGDWGFAAKSSRGLGIGALFAGGSGTGKTLAAEVLAHELRLDLFRIDVAATVSKYIGETEKNLARVFDAAEAGGAILLFDEADALFGKRSEVRDSHDRYANLEVSYLLQRIEAYRGLSILTTNMKQAIDAAFLRRLRFIVPFPFPDAAARGDIWDRVFPAQMPRRVDRDKLARLSLSGGHIRNVALGAAFLAAEEGEDAVVTMAHLRQAAEAEFVKIEKPLPKAELGDWA